jgi:uncharacterized protein YecT (DUF1311 family)
MRRARAWAATGTVAIAGLLAIVSTPAAAQPAEDRCANATTTVELDACAQQTLADRDGDLNEAYRDVLRRLAEPSVSDSDAPARAEARRLLVEAQRAWIQFRDHDCRGRLRLHEGGSMRGLVYLGCLIAHTEQRTAQLRGWTEP